MINPRLKSRDDEKRLAPFEHAVNSAEARARVVWLTLTSLSAYVLVAFLATSHEDMLLRSRQRLPILQIELPLEAFALIGPGLLLLVHLMTLVNVLYIKDALGDYCNALKATDSSSARSASWSRIASGIFIRGPGLPVPTVLLGAQWLLETITIWLAPPVIILFCQLRFLPYHDPTITWIHRITLLLDVVCIAIAAVAASRYITKQRARAGWRPAAKDLLPFAPGAAVLVAVCFLSLLVFQHRQDEYWNPLRRCGQIPCLVKWAFVDDFRSTRSSLLHRDIYAPADQAVTELADRLADRPYSISFRFRDLEGANLRGGRFYKADFRGANLREANLRDTDLREALFGCRLTLECTNLQFADLSDSLMQGADFESVQAQGASFSSWESHGAQLQRANFAHADLSGASFFADLSGAIFDGASLAGAHLSGSNLTATFLSSAYLSYADLSNTSLIGTYLEGAHLEGASLKNASVLRIQGTPELSPESEEDAPVTVDCRNLKVGELTETGYKKFLDDLRTIPTTIDRPFYTYPHLDPAWVPGGDDKSTSGLPAWIKQCTNYDPPKQDPVLVRQFLREFCTTDVFPINDVDRAAMWPLRDQFGRLYTRDMFGAEEYAEQDPSGSRGSEKNESASAKNGLVGEFYRLAFKTGECSGFLSSLRASNVNATRRNKFKRVWETAETSGIDKTTIAATLGPCDDCRTTESPAPTDQ